MAEPMTGRELAEVAALLVALGFVAAAFSELSDRLRHRILARLEEG